MEDVWTTGALLLSSFTSATVLPGTSEVALVAALAISETDWRWLIIVATFGNVMGSLTSYGMGRAVSHFKMPRTVYWVRKYGSLALLLAWVPIVGDAFCLAAGWLRINLFYSTICITIGKFLRYLAIVYLYLS